MTQNILGKPADRIVIRWIHYHFQTQVEHPNWLGKTRKAFLQNQERLFKIIITLNNEERSFWSRNFYYPFKMKYAGHFLNDKSGYFMLLSESDSEIYFNEFVVWKFLGF